MIDLPDLSSWQPRADFIALAKESPAVMLKATQGLRTVDRAFLRRVNLATSAGLLVGAYHFGTFADGAEQARHLLAHTRPGDLLALDVERDPAGPDMTLEQAEAFVRTVFAARGRWPMVYGGGDYLRDVLRPPASSVLGNCPLWWARWGASPPTWLPACWSTWTLWQYTATHRAPWCTDGEGRQVNTDRNRFAGDFEGLLRLWGAPTARAVG